MFKHIPISVSVAAALWGIAAGGPILAQSPAPPGPNWVYNGTAWPFPTLSAPTASILVWDRGDSCCTDIRMIGGSSASGTQQTHFYTYDSGPFQIHKYGAGSANGPVLTILPAGQVGIGTSNPQQLLDVAGTISAKEVIVTQTGADYVFDPGYRLAPLGEVNEFIRQHHHLPDIPSAGEMQQKGAGVADM